MKTIRSAVAAGLLSVVAFPVYAQAQAESGRGWLWDLLFGGGGETGTTPGATTVPEIDVTSAALAIAAVVAALAFAWERSRRKA